MLHSGERQVAPTLDGIRRDHLARYYWAERLLEPNSRVLDIACGVGYGAHILASAGHRVTAIDRDQEAIDWGRKHFDHPNIVWQCADVGFVGAYQAGAFDAVTCFETIEHLSDPAPLLRMLRAVAPKLLASVPNETFFPFRNYQFHYRHYTEDQFLALLAEAGFFVDVVRHQADAESEVEMTPGRTLIASAFAPPAKPVALSELNAAERRAPAPIERVPEHVVILGLGPSLEAFVDLTKRLGGRSAFCDEVWGINAVADVIQCDRVFHMDDVRIQELRAKAAPDSNIARMLAWLKRHPGPVYTSRAHQDYPGLVEYPLQDVIRSCGFAYFNSTAAYAVAYAVHIGVKKIGLFGFDFTYKDSHKAEKGRACVEFHLGIAKARGIELGFPENTSLMDACAPFEERIYGYDTLDVAMDGGGDEPVTVRLTPKAEERWVTAAQIEARYDHAKHPNRLVAK